MAECKQCGKCCLYFENGIIKPCRMLIFFKNINKTFCRIYRKRIGFEIKKGLWCNLRKNTEYDFEGCPYNTNKPIRW